MLAMIVGSPLQLLSAAFFGQERDYHRIKNFVSKYILRSDVAIVDPSAWYAIWPLTAKTYSTDYDREGRLMTPVERARVSVLVIHPWEIDKLIRRLGGTWRQEDCLCPPPRRFLIFATGFGDKLAERYELAFFRRIDAGHTPPN
jgi:hypothetical protein